MKRVLAAILILAFVQACQPKKRENETSNPSRLSSELDIQGHRGARGLLPENTIPGFLKAIDLGVTTLELDLSVTKDRQLVVSHEPWMNHTICLDSTNEIISEQAERGFNIYQMTLQEVQRFDCGSNGNPRFPEQQPLAVAKPALAVLIDTVNAYLATKGREKINYNIEIKSMPQGDSLFHPLPSEFSDLVYELIDGRIPWEQVTIQSFDFRVLRYFNQIYPDVTLAALIENEDPPADNLQQLGFNPEIYSSWFVNLSAEDVAYLHDQSVLVVPWTVNEVPDMKKLIEWGVDGIITDYPDRAQQLD